MNDKRNILLYVIIGLLVVIIIFLGILLLKREIKSDDADEKKNKQIINDTNNEDTSQAIKEVTSSVVLSNDELFLKLVGIWKYVDSNGVNFATRFTLDSGNFNIGSGRYGTDGGVFGTITDVEYKEDNIYVLTVFSPGCHGDGCMDESDDVTYYVYIDISDIDNKKIGLNFRAGAPDYYSYYEYVADSWEDAEMYFSY